MTQKLIISKDLLNNTLTRHGDFWKPLPNRSFLRSTGIYALSSPVYLKQKDGKLLDHIDKVEADLVNPDILIREIENYNSDQLNEMLALKGQYLVSVGQGDSIPLARPLLKIPWIEAMLGCTITMINGQIWNKQYSGDPELLIQKGIHFESNPWFQLYLEFIKQIQNRLDKRFLISAIAGFRGTCDLAASIMGVEEACIGWIDNPTFMARLMRVCTDAILTVVEAVNKIRLPSNNGYPCQGVWAPDKTIVTQADHAILLSPETYKQQILPYDLEVIQSCPISSFHLHNCGLHLAPILIEVPELDAIKIYMDPYPIEESRKLYEINILKKILQYKPLILDVYLLNLKEGEWLLDNLPKNRLFFKAWFDYEIYNNLPDDFPGRKIWLSE